MNRFRKFALSLVVLTVISGPGLALAQLSYTEDFTTTVYRDPVNTTAHWDTTAGELKLPAFAIALAGSCDTSGQGYGVAVSGDHAFLADGTSGLRVIDISDPTNPVLAGSYDTPGAANGVAVSGDHAFVAEGTFGFRVIDISDPMNPASVGICSTLSEALNVAVSGDHAFVADYAAGLLVIDISDPTSPVPVGSCGTASIAMGIAVSGDYAFVADWISGLHVIDISDPTNPVLAGVCDTPGTALGVAVSGNRAFVADESSGLQVIDISDPANPVSIGGCDTPGDAWAVALSGNRAFVADGSSGLHMFDISDPANPVFVGGYDTPGDAWAVAVSGNHAFVADGSSGLQAIVIGDPVNPVFAGSCDTPSDAWIVAVAGDYAFVPSGPDLLTIDISDPTNPVLAGSCNTPGNANSVAVSGDHAFVADSSSGFQVLDISDPTSPVLAGGCDTPGDAYGVAVSGDYAFVVDSDADLVTIDISDPTNPVLAGSCHTPGFAWSVALSGDYAFVTDWAYGLQVIDISDPTNPVLVGGCDTPGTAFGVAVSGNRAFVADESSGLQVIDISDPANPVSVGGCDTPGDANSVAVSGDDAFVADGSSGLQVIDISDPANPVLAGSYGTSDSAEGVVVSGDCAFVAARSSGLNVVQVRQNEVACEIGVGQSLELDGGADMIARARLTSTETTGVAWEVSANAGTNWQIIAPDASWSRFSLPGDDLQWRSTHSWSPSGNPAVSDLALDWLNEFGPISSITDVPDDQGGWLRLRFTRSAYDFVDEVEWPVTGYQVFRRVDDAPLRDRVCEDGEIPGAVSGAHPSVAPFDRSRLRVFEGREYVISGDREEMPPGTWEVLTWVAADQSDEYLVQAQTVTDSTSAGGIHWSVFITTTHTASPSIWFASHPDSGYSVDNVAPAVPTGFAVNYTIVSGNELSWEPSGDEDFQHFHVYRDDTEEFEPSPENLVHMTIDVAWVDPEGTPLHHYKVTALDHAGNESDPASPESITGVDEPAIPARFALHRSMPNPLRSATEIAYDVPADGGKVRLTVYDVAGRRVRTLVDGPQTVGRKSAAWDGRDDRGNAVGSGVYYCRLEASGYEQSIKITVLR